jgi:hypothetical protein
LQWLVLVGHGILCFLEPKTTPSENRSNAERSVLAVPCEKANPTISDQTRAKNAIPEFDSQGAVRDPNSSRTVFFDNCGTLTIYDISVA